MVIVLVLLAESMISHSIHLIFTKQSRYHHLKGSRPYII